MATKRELIEPTPGDKRYVRRDAKGQFSESVDVSRSLSRDARTQAKSAAEPGQGDRGDGRPPKTQQKTQKKSPTKSR
jgi:hypothetical protein